MSGDVIVTVTLNAALHVSYAADDVSPNGVQPISDCLRASSRIYRDLVGGPKWARRILLQRRNCPTSRKNQS